MYRGIDVKFKVLKNTDGSHRSYKIVEVGDSIRTEHNQIPQEDEVRSVIDNHYNQFQKLMDGVALINEQEFTKMFIDKSVKCTVFMKKMSQQNIGFFYCGKVDD